MSESKKPAASNKPQGTDIQGEGDYRSARKYNQATREFVRSGRVDQAARAAQPRSEEEKRKLEQAEREGRSRAKDEDPAVKRDPRPNAKRADQG
jgi:hypothetical protein